MPTLRLTQTRTGDNEFRVDLALEGEGRPRQTAVSEFSFALTDQEQEDLRWYLEDYLTYPLDPAPLIAARIERDMARIGEALFEGVFHSQDARDLWAVVRPELGDMRIEIATGVREAAAIPWELIRDPKTEARLALVARSFVRTHSNAAQRPRLPGRSKGPIRILLVICRPGGEDDVPFRSVASRLLKSLTGAARESFELVVLRPPTFEQLGRKLRAAKADGQPFHVVHFDGHGTYGDAGLQNPALVLRAARGGEHGYLVFENPAVEGNKQYVDGPTLGRLLAETSVPVLVLNACRSAHAEPPSEPVPVTSESPHTEVRTFGSLAQEVMDAGVAGVVAMRYNVYVVTAAQFIGELYARLVEGNALGEAATMARKQLADQPLRTIVYEPLPLEDWPVPVVYENASVALFPRARTKLAIQLGEATVEGALDRDLPPRPDAGFYGRDETLLKLDRAFDTQSIVLLHAWAGSGKTLTAAEFGRWYKLTGGLEGPVLFTSFEQYKPLARVLGHFGEKFEAVLEQAGFQWFALAEEGRRDVALQVMRQVPLLWIWDNVEPVAGFPRGTPSLWSEAEQQELKRFLQDARETKAKFLLTSRRDERDWLGDLPARIDLPPMPMQEMLELARTLAEKRQRRIADLEDWRPLLRFTQGNPLTLTVIVGQALRDGLRTRAQVEAFVERLRVGEAAFVDEAIEGRTRSLAASLNYGFEHAFTEAERTQLAVLHLFQGVVNVIVLRVMGAPEVAWNLPEVRGLGDQHWTSLLDRASDVGLLVALGGGSYGIHPALPWFFRKLFVESYCGSETRATKAFVEAMGDLGDYCHQQYESGNRGVIQPLSAEESNLLHARRLARAHGSWQRVISTMQGLRPFYAHMGRRAEWKRLVDEIVPDFVDPATDKSLPGREDGWSRVTGYRIHVAIEERNWPVAERIVRVFIDWNRRRVAPVLATPCEEISESVRNAIRNLSVSLGYLGHVLLEQVKAESVAAFEEAFELGERIGDLPGAAVDALNLGTAYKDLPEVRDLRKAELWYRRSLKFRAQGDGLGRARCHGQLGLIFYERFLEARSAGRPAMELLKHLNDAAGAGQLALSLLPAGVVNELATIHDLLGNIYGDAEDFDRALHHHRESIRYEEQQGNLFGAAKTRCNVAITLERADRLTDALVYAEAALRNYETYGDRARKELQETYQLIAQIRGRLKREM